MNEHIHLMAGFIPPVLVGFAVLYGINKRKQQEQQEKEEKEEKEKKEKQKK